MNMRRINQQRRNVRTLFSIPRNRRKERNKKERKGKRKRKARCVSARAADHQFSSAAASNSGPISGRSSAPPVYLRAERRQNRACVAVRNGPLGRWMTSRGEPAGGSRLWQRRRRADEGAHSHQFCVEYPLERVPGWGQRREWLLWRLAALASWLHHRCVEQDSNEELYAVRWARLVPEHPSFGLRGVLRLPPRAAFVGQRSRRVC